MTISHVIYLEFARLIVSWQWVTEVQQATVEKEHGKHSLNKIYVVPDAICGG